MAAVSVRLLAGAVVVARGMTDAAVGRMIVAEVGRAIADGVAGVAAAAGRRGRCCCC